VGRGVRVRGSAGWEGKKGNGNRNCKEAVEGSTRIMINLPIWRRFGSQMPLRLVLPITPNTHVGNPQT
jgi:hypothetical protein